jgi:hypothetical protein
MKTNPNKLWIVVIALGWLFDFLFWKKAPGVNFAIFTTLCLAGAFFLLLSDGLRPNRYSLLLLPLFGFFAVITFVRAEPMTTFLACTFTLFSMSVLAVSYLGGRWIQYTISDYFGKFLSLFGSMIARPLTFSSEIRKAQTEAGMPAPKRNIWPMLRGIIIALPVVAIFAALLASADVVFSQRLDDFIQFFNLEKLPEYIFRLIYILILGYALAGVILHASAASKDEKLVGEDKPFLPPFLGFTESAIVMGSVVLLFLTFVVIQFQYFFGGQANIHIDGYTYSEYARRGFGELVAVAFFSLLMLLALSAVTKRETESQRRAFSGLGVALVALVLVMLVSAYQRLVLYEAAYGFSRLRAYTHAFLVWIGLLLVATIVLEILHKERAFALAALLASLGFAMTLPILNVDAFIVRQNIQREVRGSAVETSADGRVALDSQYFINLSDDAVPSLVTALQTSTLPASVREEIGAALACIRYERSSDERQLPWQSFHLSRFYADNALASVKKELDQYQIDDKDWPVKVATPEGKEFSCWSYYID